MTLGQINICKDFINKLTYPCDMLLHYREGLNVLLRFNGVKQNVCNLLCEFGAALMFL